MAEALSGPLAYRNWIRMREGAEHGPELEYPLYSDAWLAGRWNHGPYGIVTVLRETPDVPRTVAAVLRLTYYRSSGDLSHGSPLPDHGGRMHDEIAALAALTLGVRLKAGRAYTRRWGFDDDPKGQPVSHEEPVLVPVASKSVLPRLAGIRQLDQMSILASLPDLSPRDASALILAARLYQQGVWIADADPEYGWLLLISAVETAANSWRASNASARERMKTSRPALDALLVSAGGNDLADRVADLIADYMGATRNFRDFLLSFLAPPPAERCREQDQIEWDEHYFRNALPRIYAYRSRKLHGGTSFPDSLCQAPISLEERPVGYAHPVTDGISLSSEVPMLIHVFEYLARNALLRWWASCVVHRPLE